MKTTRRDALAHGGRIIATAAVLPFLPSVNIAHAEDDAGLFAQYEKCCQLDKAYVDATEKADKACFAVRETIPKPPNYQEPWKQNGTTTTPEQGEYDAKLAEAKARAGVPALYEKAKATEDAMRGASADFYYTPALTAAGMILKIKYAWSDQEIREFRAQANGEAEFYDFDRHVIGSLLLDLERLDGRRA